MSIKVVDLERYLKEAERDRDNFMKRVASLEGENKALEKMRRLSCQNGR